MQPLDESLYETKLDETVPVETYLERFPLPGPLRSFIAACVRASAGVFGTPARVPSPQARELTKLVEVGSLLKEAGYFEEFAKRIPYPGEPFFYNYYAAPGGTGAHMFDKASAMWSALGEAVERKIWLDNDEYKNDLIIATQKELGERALNLKTIVGFSDVQRDAQKKLQFNDETPFGWLQAESIVSGKKVMCPAQLLSAKYRNTHKDEPMLRWIVTTGLATGQSAEEAIAKGMLEVIERDAFMIKYLNHISPPRIDHHSLSEQDETIAEIVRRVEKCGLEIHFLMAPTDFPVHVINAAIVDHSGDGPAFTIGASAHTDLKTALLHATDEALRIRHMVYKTHTDDVGPVEKLGLTERVQYWAKPEHFDDIRFMIEGPVTEVTLKDTVLSSTTGKRARRNYHKNINEKLCAVLREKKYEALYADLTPSALQDIDLRTVSVVIPELQPLHLEESIPYRTGARLKEVPRALGYTPLERVYEKPHPFS